MAIKSKLVQLKNDRLANTTVSTFQGKFNFDENGTVKVSEDLANLLVKELLGFSIVEDKKADVEEKTSNKVEGIKIEGIKIKS